MLSLIQATKIDRLILLQRRTLDEKCKRKRNDDEYDVQAIEKYDKEKSKYTVIWTDQSKTVEPTNNLTNCAKTLTNFWVKENDDLRKIMKYNKLERRRATVQKRKLIHLAKCRKNEVLFLKKKLKVLRKLLQSRRQQPQCTS